jgi:hypothetical protein
MSLGADGDVAGAEVARPLVEYVALPVAHAVADLNDFVVRRVVARRDERHRHVVSWQLLRIWRDGRTAVHLPPPECCLAPVASNLKRTDGSVGRLKSAAGDPSPGLEISLLPFCTRISDV